MKFKQRSLTISGAIVLMLALTATAQADGDLYGRDWTKGEKIVVKAEKQMRKSEELIADIETDIAKEERRIADARSGIAKLQQKKLKAKNNIDEAASDLARGEAIKAAAKAAYEQSIAAPAVESASATPGSVDSTQ